jgi:sialate O-acetylesterase
MRKLSLAAWVAAVLVLTGQTARADVKPNALFSDGMVLQHNKDPRMGAPVWGTADPGERVVVTLFNKEGGTTRASVGSGDKDGKWQVTVSTPEAGGPYTLSIKGKNEITFSDVYVGEVWVCSGQSNMEWPLRATADAEKAIENSKNPKIRLFTVARATSKAPRLDVVGKWSECGPDTVGGFSAVAYYFGRDLQKTLNVPVGLIHSSWGGTVAEAWTGKPALEADPDLKYLADNFTRALENYDKAIDPYLETLEGYVAAAKKARAEGKEVPPLPPSPPNPAGNPNSPTVLYNAMIKPLQPYAIRGAIWYQGESNAGRAYEYRTLFPTMIKNWRKDWAQKDEMGRKDFGQKGEFVDFPFLFVQLAPWQAIVNEPQESAWAELREAQLFTSLKLKNTGMAVITDVGDPKDIHPKQKEPVGARLALAARAIAYGEKVVYEGPLFDHLAVEGNKAVLSFKNVGKGLECRGEALQGFTIAGEDKTFHDAKAEIKGDQIVVWSDEVARPVAVRYGWANFPVVNLWNKDGLPASPFRTDDFPMLTAPKKN